MTGRGASAILRPVALAVAVSALLGGCSYDYLQHTDRVTYSAGDAVTANLERETTNPEKSSMYVTSGLGRNGPVINPANGAGPSSGTTSGSGTAATP